MKMKIVEDEENQTTMKRDDHNSSSSALWFRPDDEWNRRSVLFM